ncbi:hypothetical protein JKP88DRAFT_309903 [Tribonema minus]|uniref:Tyrosine--tRNA ligase n=1 Tax=Tribonema minus TaxID=303371 RepID=A0A835Z418_9STRA|nr:hypothetical protein JKP88DRAFT_309903 [Tribonema minus]
MRRRPQAKPLRLQLAGAVTAAMALAAVPCARAFMRAPWGVTVRRLAATTSSTRTAKLAMSVAEGQKETESIPATAPAASGLPDASSVKSAFLKTMISRGFFNQCTDLEGLDKKLLENGGVGFAAYLGFDATADSLHVGSLTQIMILRHLQKCGHKPLVLVGGGTTKVGDPSGRDESRQLLDDAAIQRNKDGITSVFNKFLTFGEGASDALLVDNDEWLSSLGYIQFLREYGPYFTINRMLSFDSVRLRLEREQPLTFLEFNYMLLQAYDFVELHKRYGCSLQMGGSDQWGNMVNGVELGRRTAGAELYALTAPLITTSDGRKMGKSAAGAVWLNADRLPPYDYWQFWRNTDDADVARFLKLFTELPLERIAELEKLEGKDINAAKIVLADEATRMLHGEHCLESIRATAKQLFEAGAAGGSNASLPRTSVSQSEVDAGLSVLDLYVKAGLAASKGEVRRLIKGGGAKINDVKVDDELQVVGAAEFAGGELKLSSGKKKHAIVEIA